MYIIDTKTDNNRCNICVNAQLFTCPLNRNAGWRADGSKLRIGLQEIFLQFGQDVLSVRVLLQCGDVRPEKYAFLLNCVHSFLLLRSQGTLEQKHFHRSPSL